MSSKRPQGIPCVGPGRDGCGGGTMHQRPSGLYACNWCGKVVGPRDPHVLAHAAAAQAVAEDGLAKEQLPDYSEALIGWRAWGVPAYLRAGEVPLLQSVTVSGTWPTRQAFEATCRYGGKDHVPGEACSCGLYSAKTFAHLQSMAYHVYDAEAKGLFHVVGEVALWGKVREGTQGWRSQFGYPKHLYLPFEAWHLRDALREAYGVPVNLKNILAPER